MWLNHQNPGCFAENLCALPMRALHMHIDRHQPNARAMQRWCQRLHCRAWASADTQYSLQQRGEASRDVGGAVRSGAHPRPRC